MSVPFSLPNKKMSVPFSLAKKMSVPFSLAAQTAKDFHMTPEQLDRFIRRELGDPIVVDRDLIVGIHRDVVGHVTAVQITTPQRDLTFNRSPDEKHAGLRYGHLELSNETPNLAAAEDIDGDGQIDRMMLTPEGEKLPHILLRIGAEFVQAQAVGDGLRFRTSDGRVFRFDMAKHEWEVTGGSP